MFAGAVIHIFAQKFFVQQLQEIWVRPADFSEMSFNDYYLVAALQVNDRLRIGA